MGTRRLGILSPAAMPARGPSRSANAVAHITLMTDESDLIHGITVYREEFAGFLRVIQILTVMNMAERAKSARVANVLLPGH